MMQQREISSAQSVELNLPGEMGSLLSSPSQKHTIFDDFICPAKLLVAEHKNYKMLVQSESD